MNLMIWLMRAKQWARNPPSEGRVKLIFGVIALCLMVAGYEWLFGWPDWLVPGRLAP
jgi:hypothetical protein